MSTPLALSPTYQLDGWTGNATDSAGVDWVITEETGWSDAAPVRITTADREDAHGGFSGPVWRGARLINLRGLAMATTQAGMLQAKERLRDVADEGHNPFPLTVTEAHGLTRIAYVKQADALRIRDRGSVAFEFEFSLRADDPLRYATAQVSAAATLPLADTSGANFPLVFPVIFGTGPAGGVITVEHPGTASVYPVVSITGPVANPVVRNVTTGHTSAFGIDLLTGETLVADHAARTVLVNGVNRRSSLLPTSSWWQIDPGSTLIRFTAAGSAGTPNLTVTFRPAWK